MNEPKKLSEERLLKIKQIWDDLPEGYAMYVNELLGHVSACERERAEEFRLIEKYKAFIVLTADNTAWNWFASRPKWKAEAETHLTYAAAYSALISALRRLEEECKS